MYRRRARACEVFVCVQCSIINPLQIVLSLFLRNRRESKPKHGKVEKSKSKKRKKRMLDARNSVGCRRAHKTPTTHQFFIVPFVGAHRSSPPFPYGTESASGSGSRSRRSEMGFKVRVSCRVRMTETLANTTARHPLWFVFVWRDEMIDVPPFFCFFSSFFLRGHSVIFYSATHPAIPPPPSPTNNVCTGRGDLF